MRTHCEIDTDKFLDILHGSHAGFKYFINSYSKRRISHLGISDKFSIKMTSGEMLSSIPRYEVQGIQKPKRSLHSSSDEEDEFSELGLPVSKGGGVLQLLTEKSETSLLKQNGDPSRRNALRMAWHAKNKSIKGPPQKQINLYEALHFDVGNHNGVSTTASDFEDAHKDKQSRTIRIENIPPTINIYQLREAVSVFGEISSAYMRDSNRSYQSCHVEYKSVESKQRAIAAQEITLKSFHLPISNLQFQKNIHIRISNISKDTAEASIHSICMACGPLEGLKRTKDGALDVFFNVKDTSTRHEIIKILNDSVIDGRRWSAKLVSGDNSSTATTNPGDDIHFREGFTTLLSDFKKQFEVKKTCLQDLELLHDTLVHLQDGEAAC
ncbi:RNA recognition motif domain [Macleaya cordata]|uniref:RNA recognition motif domain n=1 Tax=Macleaya cordata TaxID=56857 RepID=A0A200PWG4_MACCD|nr:RNA recognition motif domain [Macleaya cordata]